MKRHLIALVAALGLAGAALAPAPVLAQSGKAQKAKKPAKKAAVQQCRSKHPDGSIKKWTCGKTQVCCVNHTFGLYTCGSQTLRCL